MTIFFIGIIILLIGIVFKEVLKRKSLEKDLQEVNCRVKEFLKSEEYERVLYNTSSKEVQELLKSINTLFLDKFNEKKLRVEKEQNIRESLTNMAHDLRTPLTIIQGYIESLSMVNKSIEEKEIIDKLQLKTKDIIILVNRYFTLSKLESGDERIDISSINITRVVRENILSHYETLNRSGFNVHINLPEENIFIDGNEEALNRVMNNLISNSMKYGDYGKYLGISLEKVNNKVILEITDKGQGIKEKEINKIFDRCYTIKTTKNNYIEGSGIGLRITKVLVEAMKGTIKVKSKAYEKTTFSLEFFSKL